MYQPHDGASSPRTQLPTRRFPLPHPLLGFVREKQSEAVAKTAALPRGFSLRNWGVFGCGWWGGGEVGMPVIGWSRVPSYTLKSLV